MSPILRAFDILRGRLALIHEAYWLAIADMPHSEECVSNDTSLDCDCWRSAADVVDNECEAEKLCTRLRDAEDMNEALAADVMRLSSVLDQAMNRLSTDERSALELLLRELA